MEFSKEMIEKAKTAASADELIKLAAEAGIELTAEDAEKYFSLISGNCELSDEEMNEVAGGKGVVAQFSNGQTVQFWYSPRNATLVGKIFKMYPHDDCWTYAVRLSIGIHKGDVLDKLPLESPEYNTLVIG